MPEYDPVQKISIVPRGAAGGLTFFAPSEERLESGLYRWGERCVLLDMHGLQIWMLSRKGMCTVSPSSITSLGNRPQLGNLLRVPLRAVAPPFEPLNSGLMGARLL